MKLNNSIKEELISIYKEAKEPILLEDLSKKYSISLASVKKILKEAGVEIRRKNEKEIFLCKKFLGEISPKELVIAKNLLKIYDFDEIKKFEPIQKKITSLLWFYTDNGKEYIEKQRRILKISSIDFSKNKVESIILEEKPVYDFQQFYKKKPKNILEYVSQIKKR